MRVSKKERFDRATEIQDIEQQPLALSARATLQAGYNYRLHFVRNCILSLAQSWWQVAQRVVHFEVEIEVVEIIDIGRRSIVIQAGNGPSQHGRAEEAAMIDYSRVQNSPSRRILDPAIGRRASPNSNARRNFVTRRR